MSGKAMKRLRKAVGSNWKTTGKKTYKHLKKLHRAGVI